MSYTNKIAYPKNWEFSIEELSPISPEMIYRWFAYLAFGIENPSPDDNPTKGKCNSLLAYKKMLSFFMINRLPSWDELHRSGNPTKSSIVNDLIAFVKKKETRGQGKRSCADRAFEHSEFQQVLDSFHHSERSNFNCKYRYPAMIKFMFHYVARGDDAAHVFKSSLQQSSEYPWALLCTLRWAKNVREQRDCPPQIMLGSINPNYCVMLSLAIFLEEWISRGQGRTSQWLFSDGNSMVHSPEKEIQKEVDRCKGGLYNAIKSIVKSATFVCDPVVANSPNPLANHSTKKYATTHGRRRGVPKDFMDYRARWRSKKIQETYTDTVLPWPDIKAASTLCFGGICKYKLKPSVTISDEWLADHVCPAIQQCFGLSVAAILAKPLLWACMDEVWSDYVPAGLRSRIINSLAEDEEYLHVTPHKNMVEKVLCVVSEYEGVVTFSEVNANYDTSERRAVASGGSEIEWRNIMIGKVCAIENKVHDIENNHAGHYGAMMKRLDKMDNNLKRLAIMPAWRGRNPRVGGRGDSGGGGGGGGSNESELVPPANLCNCPKNLYVLWAEYESGIGGNKPARLFTASERGAVRFKYCRRKIVWDAVEALVQRGLTSDVAIDRIYSECGGVNAKVNDVISRLKHFRVIGNAALHMHRR
jgi:hypothetical protein